MIPAERMIKIMDIIERKKYVSIKELASAVYVSVSTIRRDLIELEKSGLIIRTRGGASLVSANTFELSSYVRSNENISLKQYIASLALTFINDDMSLFVDASSTVSTLCNNLKSFRKLIIITNSAAIPYTFNDFENIQVYSSGGFLKPHSHYFVGANAGRYLSQFAPDYYFMSCKSIDQHGIYDTDYEQIQIKKEMIKNAKKVILLIDSTKFGSSSYIRINSLESLDLIITDKKPKIYDEFSNDIKDKIIRE